MGHARVSICPFKCIRDFTVDTLKTAEEETIKCKNDGLEHLTHVPEPFYISICNVISVLGFQMTNISSYLTMTKTPERSHL